MKIPYLSPTTFIKFTKICEWRVYLEKVKQVLPKDEYEKEQTMAAATGTAVDIMIKGALNRRVKVEEELKKEIQPRNEASILLAREIFEYYNHGPLQALKAEGVGYGGVDQEIELEWEEPVSPSMQIMAGKVLPIVNGSTLTKTWKSVIYGRPDLTLKSGEVLDWKCQGMFGRGTRPRDGYTRCFVFGRDHPMHGKDMGSSPKGDDKVPMEQINEDWAIQLYLYNRLLGHRAGEPLRAGIENICVDYPKKNQPVIFCASYRNPISQYFQLSIEKKFHDAYNRLIESDTDHKVIESANPAKYRCITYNRLCSVSQFCEAYKIATMRGRDLE